MPPKPFKPPRPSSGSATTTSTSGPGRGRPRKSDSTSTSTSTSTNTTKRKSTSSLTKAASNPNRRISAREMGLPSLSPETEAASPSASNSQAEGEVSDDPFASQPAPTSKQKKRRREEEETEEEEEEKERIPGDLISVLLHEFFSDGTRMTKGANGAVGKYLDVFVREGVARCVFRAAEGGGGEGGVVEVEDLEKEAPQLLLDF